MSVMYMSFIVLRYLETERRRSELFRKQLKGEVPVTKKG